MVTNILKLLLAASLALMQIEAYAEKVKFKSALETEREIAFSSHLHTDNGRRALLKADLLMKVADDYNKNPERYIIRQRWSSAVKGYEPVYPPIKLELNEVLKNASNSIDKAVHGWDPKEETAFKVFMAASAALPTALGIAVSVGGLLIPEVEAKSTYQDIKLYEQIQKRAITVGLTNSDIGNMIRDYLYESTELNVRETDFSQVPLVKSYREHLELMRNIKKTHGELAATNKGLELITNYIAASAKKEVEAAIAKAKEEKFQSKKQDVLAGIGAAGYAMQLMNIKHADKVFEVRNIVGQVMDLSRGGLSPMVAAQGYLGVAVAIQGLFAKEESAEQQMLQQLIKTVAELRKEMHERFDRVDLQLATILQYQIESHKETMEALSLISADIKAIEKYIKTRTDQIGKTVLATHNDNYTIQRNACLAGPRATTGKLSEQEIADCINHFSTYANVNSVTDFHVNNEIDEAKNASALFPYANSLVYILNKINNVEQTGLSEKLSINKPILYTDVNELGVNLPHPQNWLNNTRDFNYFMSLSPKYLKAVDDSTFSVFKNAGEALQTFYKHLMVTDDGRIRESILNTLLYAYKSNLIRLSKIAESDEFQYVKIKADTAESRDRINFNEAIKKRVENKKNKMYSKAQNLYIDTAAYPIKVGQYRRQLNDFTVRYFRYHEQDQNTKWCNNKTRYLVSANPENYNQDELAKAVSMLRYESIDDPFGKEATAVKPIIPIGFYKTHVSNYVRQLELAEVAEIDFCVAEYKVVVNHAKFISNSRANMNFSYELTIHAVAQVKSSITQSSTQSIPLESYTLKNTITWNNISTTKAALSKSFSQGLWQRCNSSKHETMYKVLTSKEEADRSKIQAKDIRTPEQKQIVEELFSSRLSDLRTQAFTALRNNEEFKLLQVQTEEIRKLIDALITIGLRPHFTGDSDDKMMSLLRRRGGLKRAQEITNLLLVDGATAAQVEKRTQKLVNRLLDILNTASSFRVTPVRNALIEEQLRQLWTSKNSRDKLSRGWFQKVAGM